MSTNATRANGIQPSPWQTGLVMGVTAAALSLRPSGLRRGPIAQSFLATASFAMGMGVGIGLDKGINKIAKATGQKPEVIRAGAIGAGLLGIFAVPLHGGKQFPYANTLHSIGQIAAVAGAAGIAAEGHNWLANKATEAGGRSHGMTSGAMMATEAFTLLGYLAWRRHVNAAVDPTTPTLKTAAAAVAAVTGAATLVGAEQTLTNRYKKKLGDNRWLVHGAAVLGVAGLAAGGLVIAKKIKARTSVPTPPLNTALKFISGGPGSLVDPAKLSPSAVGYLNSTLTAAEITKVTGREAIDPIRVAISLDHGKTPADRAKLALDELQRLGAFDRSHLFVTVPPGAGKIDPPLMQAAEYMADGDIASVVIQYSNKPSALSLHKVDDGAATYKALFDGFLERTKGATKKPEVLVYGNSLGAWASQDTAAGKGVAGMPAIDRALWVGSPGPSGFFRDMFYSKDPKFAADRELVHQYSTAEELRQAVTSGQADGKRFFFHTRHSDPVPKVDFDMLWRRPLWLREEFREVSGAPVHEVYTPGVSFLQEITDTAITASIADDPAKAQIGHTYHTDIPSDVRDALLTGKVSDTTFAKVQEQFKHIVPVNK